MAIKTFTSGEVLTASDTNIYLNNGGLVYLTSSNISGTSVSINNCFNSAYQNYEILINVNNASNSTYFLYQNRASGVNSVSSYTSVGILMGVSGGTQTNNNFSGVQAVSSARVGYVAQASSAGGSRVTVLSPQILGYTNLSWQGGGRNNDSGLEAGFGNAIHYLAAQYDGFTLSFSSTISGIVRVYGYRQA